MSHAYKALIKGLALTHSTFDSTPGLWYFITYKIMETLMGENIHDVKWKDKMSEGISA
jgi:hypothetical protein